MAKEQGLSLNPVKISGTCGRLMCCLKYEQEAYADLFAPYAVGELCGNDPGGQGRGSGPKYYHGQLGVRLDSAPEAAPQTFQVKQVKLLRGKGGVEKKEPEADIEDDEEVLDVEGLLDLEEEKPEKSEQKERTADRRPPRDPNTVVRREQSPKDRENVPRSRTTWTTERRERPQRREGRPQRARQEKLRSP